VNSRSIFSTSGFAGDSRAFFINRRTLRDRGLLRAGFFTFSFRTSFRFIGHTGLQQMILQGIHHLLIYAMVVARGLWAWP
jgi:hypothetical protein